MTVDTITIILIHYKLQQLHLLSDKSYYTVSILNWAKKHAHTQKFTATEMMSRTASNNNNNTRLTDLFRDYPGELIPER